MAILGRCLFVWLTLLVGVTRLVAAVGEAEQQYRAATNSLAGGFWERAERELAEFIAKHPESEHLPDAVLRRAQAQFNLRKYAELIVLLTAGRPKAGSSGRPVSVLAGRRRSFKAPITPRPPTTRGELARVCHNSSGPP